MLQIFTYSTGLALTGRSAACAPASATRPATEPRRRLFTIFIVTSKFVNRGRVPLFGSRSFLEGPQLVPRETTRLFISHHHGATFENPDGATWGCPPPVAFATLIKRPAHTMKKPPNHRARGAFCGTCCANDTSSAGVEAGKKPGRK